MVSVYCYTERIFNNHVYWWSSFFFLFCFGSRPNVSFNIRLLKAVQLMEFPLLRQWITQMVNDYLKLGIDCFTVRVYTTQANSALRVR